MSFPSLALLRSLKLRLLIGTTLSMALVLALLGVALDFAVHRSLLNEFDTSMLAEARALASMSEQAEGKTKFEFDATQMPEFSAVRHPAYFQIRLDDGRILARSVSLDSRAFGPATASPTPATTETDLPDGRHGRMLAMQFTPRLDPELDDHDEDDKPTTGPTVMHTAILVVARDTGVLHHTMERLENLIIIFCAAAVALCGTVLMFVTTGAIRPVGRLAREIETLGETDLSRQIKLTDVPTELAPVVDRLNELLHRLDTAFGRERAFTSDAAHELRTPLAGILTSIEVCRSRPRETAEYEAALDKCRRLCTGMQTMIENLLLLARAEAGQLPLVFGAFDLSFLLGECWALFEPRSRERQLAVTWSVDRPCPIRTDRGKLQIVLNNLLDNAVSYADQNGFVTIEAHGIDDTITVHIANTGSRVAPEQAAQLTQRFWRGDQSRTGGEHCGLGLSLCQRLVEILGGRMTIETADDGWFRVTLHLQREMEKALLPARPALD
jgi:two-component system, OmpR family, heavy metal sensor histidine kinase CusS